MIGSLYRAWDGTLHLDLPPDRLAAALADAQGLLWLHLQEETPAVCEPVLREVFGFHPLAVEDALQQSHVPKVDDWGEYLYLVLHAVTFDRASDEPLDTLELDLFLGRNFLVTHQTQPIAATDRLWAAVQTDKRHLARGSGHLFYKLADEVVADYMPVVEQIDAAIDEIEDEVFGNAVPSVLERIFGLKRSLLHLRRIIAPQREVLSKLVRGDFGVVDEDDRIFFRDVYDHLVRLHDIGESLRDLVSSALDTYLSVVNNRMNDVMKTLTAITVLFLPISFLVGFFGMNFFQPTLSLEAWTGWPAFALTIAATIVVPTAIFLWMRKRVWGQMGGCGPLG